MFTMRPFKARTVSSPSTRMKPAIATMSGRRRSTAASSAASNAARSLNCACGTTWVATPAARARSRPAASARLLTTPATLAGMRRAATASRMACRLRPCPEIRTAMRGALTGRRDSDVLDEGMAGDDLAEFPRRQPGATQLLQRARRLGARHREDEADAAVEGAAHLGLGHAAFLLQPVEHGGALPARRVHRRAAALREHPRQVLGDAATGDVGHALHAHVGEQLQYR